MLRISGPEDLLDADEVKQLFHSRIRFDLVHRREQTRDGENVIEFQFSSIRGQCRAASKCFMEEIRGTELDGLYECWSDPDPCDQAHTG